MKLICVQMKMRQHIHSLTPLIRTSMHVWALQLETGLFATYVNSPDECQLINSMLEVR